ncbi:MAG: LptF/LptG family permease [Candidatus Omnitrophota bacterium]
MKILEKYIFKNYIAALLFCVVLLMVLGVIGDILGFLDDIFKKNIPLVSILSFYFYFAPFAFVNMVPFAALLSSVHVFNNLSKNHEVTAVITSGLSLWKILRPVILVTFVLCLVTFIVNDRFVPASMEKANRIRQEELERAGEDEGTVVRNLAIYGKGNQIIFAKAYVPRTKTLENVIIHKQDKDRAVKKKISARLAKWRNGDYWLGTDVIVFDVDPAGNFIGDPSVYKSRKLPIAETPKDFIVNQWDPRLMSYGQLKRHIKIFKESSPLAVRRLLVDLNYKLAFPFAAMAIVMVGIPFSIASGRSNALIGMAKGIAMALLYLPVMAISLALGKGGTLPPVIAAWLSNVLFILFGAHLINKKS